MNIKQIEILINDSLNNSSINKINSTQIFEQIKNDSNKWNIGLELFYSSSSDVAKLFGLTLIRDYLRSYTNSTYSNERLNIRQSILNWVQQSFKILPKIEAYVINNIASILTLCIKCDFPENWPNAFEDILQLSELGWIGIDLCVRIIADLDVEVVMFSESRSQEEINHNRTIKDAMRLGTILYNIVNLLTSSAAQSIHKDEYITIGELCLNTLATMIGWIDINLIVNDNILPQIYQFLQCSPLSSHACGCILEIVKKGMDPTEKVKLIANIGVINILSQLPFNPTTCEDETIEDDIGTIIDVIFLELIGCWIEFENYVLTTDLQSIENSPLNSPMRSLHEQMGAIGQLTGEQLQLCIPVLMKVFSHGESIVSATVINAMKKLVNHIKKQQPQNPSANELISESILVFRNMYPDWFFVAADFILPILSGIYSQLQYTVHFYESSLEADEDDEEIAAEIEAKNQMRQLFVACCRICPLSCLDLITGVFSSIPQPLYTAPFPPLEAALRLVHAFGECGTHHQLLVTEGLFPRVIEAIHQSEIHRHRHPMVLMAYYEVATRYTTQTPISTIQQVVVALVSPKGLRHPDRQLRSRSAFFMRKITESLRDDASLLLQVVGSFADLILTQTGSPPPLPEQAEMHLLEAIGLMTSARSYIPENNSNNNNNQISTSNNNATNNPEEAHLQLSLLQDMLSSLVNQLLSLLSDSNRVNRYGEQLSEIVAWKFGSLGALTKGHSPKSHNGEVSNLFYGASISILPVICEFAKYKQSRNKSIIFLHRMVQCIGYRVIELCPQSIGIFLEYSDITDFDHPVQLLNQLMSEFGTTSYNQLIYPIINEHFLIVINRLSLFYNELQQLSSNDISTSSIEQQQQHETSLEADKFTILKQLSTFLQTITSYRCDTILYSEINLHRLPEILSIIINGLHGGENDGIRIIQGIPLRRFSLTTLSNLINSWLSPQSINNIQLDVKNLFSSILCEEALPIIFRSLTSGSMNLSDAQVQGYIGDIAGLIWTMKSTLPNDTRDYFQQRLFPSLSSIRWSDIAIVELSRLLESNEEQLGSLNNFREAFKKLVRKYCNK